MVELLRRKNPTLTLAVALAGAALCLVSLGAFLFSIFTNTLPWSPEQTVREHYVAVGRSYGDGFLVGFFLCFFLTMLAVGLDRRRAARAATAAGR